MSPIYKPCMFVKGAQISERGTKFPRKYGPREAKLPRKFGPGGPNFRGGQISCDTGKCFELLSEFFVHAVCHDSSVLLPAQKLLSVCNCKPL